MQAYEYGQPPDLIGAGLGEDLNDSLLNAFPKFGNMPSQAMMMLQQMQQPQSMAGGIFEALAAGPAFMQGRPNPVTVQNEQMFRQQQATIQNMMRIEAEQRQMAITQANMAMAQRRQAEIERQNILDNQHRQEVETRLKEEQNFRRADRDLTLAQHFMASDDPTVKIQAGPLFSSAYKTLKKEEPVELIKALTSPNPPKKEVLDEGRRMVNAGMENDAILRELPTLTTPILDDMRKVLGTPGAAEKFGLKSNADIEMQQLKLDEARAKKWERDYGITEQKIGDATTAQLNKMGILPDKATPAEVVKARDLAKVTLDQDELRKEQQRANIMLAKQKEYAQFAASLQTDKPINLTQFRQLEKMVAPLAANLEITDQIKESLSKIPKDALPTGDTWAEGTYAAANRWWKYKNNEDWRTFSTFIIPKLIGFDRSTLDDIGQKSIKAFGPALEIIEGGGVPSERAIRGIVKVIEDSERRKANAIFSGLVQTRQPQDVVEYARNTLGKYLDNDLIRASGTPLRPVMGIPPNPGGNPLAGGLPPAAGNKGRKIRNSETGEVMVSDGMNWRPE